MLTYTTAHESPIHKGRNPTRQNTHVRTSTVKPTRVIITLHLFHAADETALHRTHTGPQHEPSTAGLFLGRTSNRASSISHPKPQAANHEVKTEPPTRLSSSPQLHRWRTKSDLCKISSKTRSRQSVTQRDTLFLREKY